MADTYSDLVNSKVGKQVASRLGLPRPVRLRRYAPGEPLVPGPVLVAGVGEAPLAARAAAMLRGEAIDIIPVVAVGAACVACCAPPILGALGLTVGLAAVGWLLSGVLLAATLLALALSLAIVHRRRRPAA